MEADGSGVDIAALARKVALVIDHGSRPQPIGLFVAPPSAGSSSDLREAHTMAAFRR